jgi:hypothetical protein
MPKLVKHTQGRSEQPKLRKGLKSLRETHPERADEWCYELNGAFTPDNVSAGSTLPQYWKCLCSCGHDNVYLAPPNRRTSGGTKCPNCSEPAKQICHLGCGSFAEVYENTQLMREWDWKKNNALGIHPAEIRPSSHKEVHWTHYGKTGVCKHKWTSPVDRRVSQGSGCPYCSFPIFEVCPKGCNSLAVTHPHLIEKIYFPLPELWRLNEAWKLAMTLTAGSKTVLTFFHVGKCGHTHFWPAEVQKMTQENPTGCPICCVPSHGFCHLVCNSLAVTHPRVAAALHPTKNNGLTADKIHAGSRERRWWVHTADNGEEHEWDAIVGNLTKRVKPSWCPRCVDSRGEVAVRETLKRLNISFIPQSKIKPSNYPNKLMMDFYIPSNDKAIEFDGPQHFEPVEFYGGLLGFQSLRVRDTVKNQYCLENHISLLRIHWTDLDDVDSLVRAFINAPNDIPITYSPSFPRKFEHNH